MTVILMNREVEVGSRVKSISEASAYRIEGKSLVVVMVNYRSIYKKAIELWNLVDTYNFDLLQARNRGLRMILTMLKSSALILHIQKR